MRLKCGNTLSKSYIVTGINSCIKMEKFDWRTGIYLHLDAFLIDNVTLHIMEVTRL